MASSGSVFSETLQTITTTKLEELAEQRLNFEKQYAALLAAVSNEEDLLQRLFILVDGARPCLGVMRAPSRNKGTRSQVLLGATANPRLETDFKNLDRFLEQARYDPSISQTVLEDWEKMIHQYLSIQSTKYQYADLYGKLVTEWLSSEKSTSTGGDVEMSDSFEELPGAKKLEARAEWEKVVFEPADVDVKHLGDYLQSLFITRKKGVAKAISTLREQAEQFENSIGGAKQFSVPTLRWVIEGLQSSDLLSNEKREVLKDFLSNDIILAEIGDVLNMRMVALDRWSWGDHVPLEQRRKLNGGYSIHMHEDLLQAIFLEYIGVKWSVFFKRAFVDLRNSAWKTNNAPIPKEDRLRREYYLGNGSTSGYNNLKDKRSEKHKKLYFAHQLFDFAGQRIEFQEGEEEAEFSGYTQPFKKRTKGSRHDHDDTDFMDMQPAQNQMRMQMAQQQAQQQQQHHHHLPAQAQSFGNAYGPPMAMQMPAQDTLENFDFDSFLTDGNQPGSNFAKPAKPAIPAKRPMQAKQTLLHLLSTEIVINTRLYGELACFRSVFDSWNPLLPHTTILKVLEFLGVSEKWRTFFKTFLMAPLKFTDDETAAPRLRRRGTPGSHALSDVFGEVVFACLDFAVNQATDGGMLHRLYDDIWFWSKDIDECAKAWASVIKFTKAMGVQVNDTKTGSVRIAGPDATKLPVDDRLPVGEIRWGFLYLDSDTGRFEIDEKMVDAHIEELRQQLQGKSKSVIGWIQAWNTYAATFFSSNFGKAANCFGREHVDKMLATHRRIQESIFNGGNVVQFLRKTIEERFGVTKIPDGFLFFPVELGGLDLKSPFVGLLQIRESVKEDPYDFLNEYEESERDDYANAKRTFDRGDIRRVRYGGQDPKYVPSEGADVFFSFEEYVRYREGYPGLSKADLVTVYMKLLQRPVEESIDVSVLVKQAIDQLAAQSNLKGITSNWGSMEPYWKWVAQMYGPEMVQRFGGLNVVDLGLLPIGMVSMLRQKRMKWQG